MVLPLAARIVRPPGMTTMAWVPPWPGILIGSSACWVTRSMGITTFWTSTPEGGTVPPDVAVVTVAPEDAVVADAPEAADGAVWPVAGEVVTPSLVTT